MLDEVFCDAEMLDSWLPRSHVGDVVPNDFQLAKDSR